MTRRIRITPRNAHLFFLAPFAGLFTVFFFYPLCRSGWLSFQRPAIDDAWRFAGTANYAFLFHDKLLWLATANTLFYAVALVALQVPLSLGLALLLDRPDLRGKRFFRFAFLTPFLVGGTFVATMFSVLLAPRYGLINRALGVFYKSDLAWRTDPWLARPAVVMAGVWLSVGIGMIYCLAALQAVDPLLYEAAALDGAGRWRRFLHVTLPGLRGVLRFLVLTAVASALQLFELPYVFFNGPGPRLAGLTVVMHLYQAGFEAADLAYASAVGWALVGLTAVISGGLFWLMRERA